MKFAIVFAALVAVACADLHKPSDTGLAEIEAIVAAIQSPSTDPATAALLEQQLADVLGNFIIQPAPVIVEEQSPISVGPAIIDFPLPDGGVVTAEEPAVVEAPIVPAPVATPTPAADAAAPLVQIILNINQASSAAAPVAPAPVVVPESPAVFPVNVVDQAVNEESFVPTPVQVVDALPTPVQVVDEVPETIAVGLPVIPVAPVVTLPDQLN